MTVDRHCQVCGHLCDDAGEFHPHVFCQLKKAGVPDPWVAFRDTAAMLGVSLPRRAPLVRNLRKPKDPA